MYVIAKAHPIYTMFFLFIYSIYKVPTVFILFDNSQTELCILDNCFNLDYRFHAVREREIKSMTTKTQLSTFIFSFQLSLILDQVKLTHNKKRNAIL